MRVPFFLFATAFLGATAPHALASGDVTAVLAAGGELQLTGDELADEVQVDRDPVTKEFVVLGRNGTTVNGLTEYRATGVRSLRATMNGGDDVVALGGFVVKKNLSVDLGDGDDRLEMTNVRVRGRTTVHGGAGVDVVAMAGRCDLQKGGLIQTEDGDDWVTITDSFVRGRLRIITDDGDDLVRIEHDGFTTSASLSIRTGLGLDAVGFQGNTLQCPVEVLTGGGQDTIDVTTSRFVKSVGMNTGDDDDEIQVDHSTFDARFFVGGGAGSNSVFFVAVNVGANGSNVTAGGAGHSGHFFWAFAIVHVFP